MHKLARKGLGDFRTLLETTANITKLLDLRLTPTNTMQHNWLSAPDNNGRNAAQLRKGLMSVNTPLETITTVAKNHVCSLTTTNAVMHNGQQNHA